MAFDTPTSAIQAAMVRPGVIDADAFMASRRRNANQEKLDRFVEQALAEAPAKADPLAHLNAHLAHLQAHARQFSRWAALPDEDDTPCPPHLIGLSALDLANARDRLSEAASQQRRAA